MWHNEAAAVNQELILIMVFPFLLSLSLFGAFCGFTLKMANNTLVVSCSYELLIIGVFFLNLYNQCIINFAMIFLIYWVVPLRLTCVSLLIHIIDLISEVVDRWDKGKGFFLGVRLSNRK